MIDLEPAARETIRVLDGVADSDLDRPTPCDETSVAALLDHFMGLSLAFTKGARKTGGDGSTAPRADAANLDPAWRTVLPQRLRELVEAWRDPGAWDGFTEVGGARMPGAVMGVVALDEVVMHGWDLARATGQRFTCDAASTAAVLEFTAESARPENAESRKGIFGPVVSVAEDASPFDRALGFAGRDPHWTAGTG